MGGIFPLGVTATGQEPFWVEAVGFLLALTCSNAGCYNFRIRPGKHDITTAFRSTLRTILNDHPSVGNYDHASTKIRTLNFQLGFRTSAHVPPRGLPLTLGRRLPPSVQILTTRAIPRSFRTQCTTRAGACLCHVRGGPVSSPFSTTCCAQIPQQLSRTTVRTTTRRFIKARSFLTLYTTNSSTTTRKSAIHAVASYRIAQHKSRISVRIATSNCLCGVIHVLTNALYRINTKQLHTTSVPTVLTDQSHDQTNPALPTGNLFLGYISCPRGRRRP